MNEQKRNAIKLVVDSAVSSFVEGLISRYKMELNDDNGVVNMKKNNCFIAELGEEFMFYSAFVRSFDSSFGNVFEKMGNRIAKLSYEVRGNIDSFLLPDQVGRISSILDSYADRIATPSISHYSEYSSIYPKDITSFKRSHVTDNYFYCKEKDEHYLIELKASGDLDNKKARAEKTALLEEYFLLKNQLRTGKGIKIFFGTAYNKFGEKNPWKQERVKQFFATEELLIGEEYWNFVCNDSSGFEIIFSAYKESVDKIRKSLKIIKDMYFK